MKICDVCKESMEDMAEILVNVTIPENGLRGPCTYTLSVTGYTPVAVDICNNCLRSALKKILLEKKS